MNSVLNQNQFTQTPILGMLTHDPQPDTLVCQWNPASTAILMVGQPVKLIDTAGPQFIVDVVAAVTDGPVLGVVAYSKQGNQYKPGDQVNIAGRGNIIFLEASGAIARGAQVSAPPSGSLANDPQVGADTTNTHYILGACLGKPTAAGQLTRIQIAPGLQSGGVLTLTVP